MSYSGWPRRTTTDSRSSAGLPRYRSASPTASAALRQCPRRRAAKDRPPSQNSQPPSPRSRDLSIARRCSAATRGSAMARSWSLRLPRSRTRARRARTLSGVCTCCSPVYVIVQASAMHLHKFSNYRIHTCAISDRARFPGRIAAEPVGLQPAIDHESVSGDDGRRSAGHERDAAGQHTRRCRDGLDGAQAAFRRRWRRPGQPSVPRSPPPCRRSSQPSVAAAGTPPAAD